jgi:hypothetical protein
MGGRQAGRVISLDRKTHCLERKEELAEEFILEYSSLLLHRCGGKMD